LFLAIGTNVIFHIFLVQ